MHGLLFFPFFGGLFEDKDGIPVVFHPFVWMRWQIWHHCLTVPFTDDRLDR